MTPDKVREDISLYRAYFVEHDIEEIEYHHEQIVYSPQDTLGHCHGMLDKILDFIRAGRIEETFMWLGFIQGCLWAEGVYTIAELQDHNRPD